MAEINLRAWPDVCVAVAMWIFKYNMLKSIFIQVPWIKGTQTHSANLLDDASTGKTDVAKKAGKLREKKNVKNDRFYALVVFFSLASHIHSLLCRICDLFDQSILQPTSAHKAKQENAQQNTNHHHSVEKAIWFGNIAYKNAGFSTDLCFSAACMSSNSTSGFLFVGCENLWKCLFSLHCCCLHWAIWINSMCVCVCVAPAYAFSHWLSYSPKWKFASNDFLCLMIYE